MNRLYLALAASLAMTSLASAQTYKDSGGTIVNAVVPLNCPPGGGTCTGTGSSATSFTPLTGAQYNQPATTSTALTIPSGALYARVCALSGQMNFVDSTGDTPGTGAAPTVGFVLVSGSCIFEQGSAVLSAFKIINAVASTGTWSAAYFK